jgi:hypothetical protein
MYDLYRFGGVGRQDKRSENLCVWEGFACGIQPQLSEKFATCGSGVSTTTEMYWFANSAKCMPDVSKPHFYFAAKLVECDGTICAHGRRWGLMEIVEAPRALPQNDDTFEQFKTQQGAALRASTPGTDGKATYRSWSGRSIHYVINEDRPQILDVDGVTIPPWETSGDVLTSDRAGHATIRGPVSGSKIDIDFTDWQHPKRTP